MININDLEAVATDVASTIAQPILRSMYSVSRNQLFDLIKDVYITSFRKGRESSESEIRELRDQLQHANLTIHAAEEHIKGLREKLDYAQDKLGTILVIDEMLYLRGFDKPTDFAVSDARWKVIVKTQSLAREALEKLRGGK